MDRVVDEKEVMLQQFHFHQDNAVIISTKRHTEIIQTGTRRPGSRATSEARRSQHNLIRVPKKDYSFSSVSNLSSSDVSRFYQDDAPLSKTSREEIEKIAKDSADVKRIMQQRTKRGRKLKSKKDSRKVRGPAKDAEKKEPKLINEAVHDIQDVEGSKMKLNSINVSSEEVTSSEKHDVSSPEKSYRISAKTMYHGVKVPGKGVESRFKMENLKL